MLWYFRGADCIAYTGRDELFAVTMDTTDCNAVKKLSERLIAAIEVLV
jgi:hypothetical protein